MIQPLKSDARYTITLEHCGHAKPRHALRWCGDFIGSFTSLPAATLRAVGHKAARQSGVIEELSTRCYP